MPSKSKPSPRQTAKQRRKQQETLQWWLIGGGAVIVILAVVIFILTNRPSAQPSTSLDKSIGPDDAKVVITEYGDFQCPSCAQFALQIEPKIKEEFVETGQARFTFRQMAFIGDESQRAAEASECANDQGHFWDYYTKLYEKQNGENVGTYSDANLTSFAQELNLNMDSFNQCMSVKKYEQKVKDETLEGEQKGVRQTPSVLINDELVNWGGDYTLLHAAIQQAIQKAQ